MHKKELSDCCLAPVVNDGDMPEYVRCSFCNVPCDSTMFALFTVSEIAAFNQKIRNTTLKKERKRIMRELKEHYEKFGLGMRNIESIVFGGKSK